jgi:hypothetical protein
MLRYVNINRCIEGHDQQLELIKIDCGHSHIFATWPTGEATDIPLRICLGCRTIATHRIPRRVRDEIAAMLGADENWRFISWYSQPNTVNAIQEVTA